MAIEITMLGVGDEATLQRIAPGVFDAVPDADLTRTFLADPRHHLAVALDERVVVGMATAVHYLHPDKPVELWINEIGVAPTHRRRGIGRRLIEALLEHGRSLGCREAWVLTDIANAPAQGLFNSSGGKPVAPPPMLFSFDLSE